jgi:hypothetical protein
MYKATLYERSGVVGTGNLDLDVDEANYQKILNTPRGGDVQIQATAVRGYTGKGASSQQM